MLGNYGYFTHFPYIVFWIFQIVMSRKKSHNNHSFIDGWYCYCYCLELPGTQCGVPQETSFGSRTCLLKHRPYVLFLTETLEWLPSLPGFFHQMPLLNNTFNLIYTVNERLVLHRPHENWNMAMSGEWPFKICPSVDLVHCWPGSPGSHSAE